MAVTFISNFSDLTLVMTPTKKVVVGTDVITTPAKVINFSHGRYTTDDEDEIKFVRECKYFNNATDGILITELKEVEKAEEEKEEKKEKKK